MTVGEKLNGNTKLTLQIFTALIFGVIFGWIAPQYAVKMGVLADIFLRMIKMIIAPLIFATLTVGIAGHSDIKHLGRIGLKAIIYFEIATTLALIIGLVMANILKPGMGFDIEVSSASLAMVDKMQTSNIVHHIGFVDLLVDVFPESVIDAMAKGHLLQIVVFAIFFAISISSCGAKAKPVLDIMRSMCDIMFKFTQYVMKFAPLGVFGAISATIGQSGIKILFSYAKLIGITYLSLFAFVVLVLLLACKIIKVPFWDLLRTIKTPALLAFTTATSEAALPKAMEQMEKFGVPKDIVSFVMPMGYTFNLDGSTLYLTLATLFCAQIAGITIPLEQQLMIILALMLTSKGIAGVPRVSLVILTGTLTNFGLPIVGVAVLLGIDQILDMGRTTINLIGNCVATAVVARWERCFDRKKMEKFISSSEV